MFLDGGRGAPQAADTVETLAALGVENIIAVGMCGAFDKKTRIGEIIVPQKHSLKKEHHFTTTNPSMHHFRMAICFI